MWKYFIDHPEWAKKFTDALNTIETIQMLLDSLKSPSMPFTETLQGLKNLELEIVAVFEEGTVNSGFEFWNSENKSVRSLKAMVKYGSLSFDRESKQWIEANPGLSETLLSIRMDIEKLKLFVNDFSDLRKSEPTGLGGSRWRTAA